MVLVSKIYTSKGVPTVLTRVGDESAPFTNANANANANASLHTHMAANTTATGGVTSTLLNGRVTLHWWRQGCVVHLVAMCRAAAVGGIENNTSATQLASCQRTVVIMPSSCVHASVLCFSDDTNADDDANADNAANGNRAKASGGGRGLLGVVGVTSDAEVVCARVEVVASFCPTNMYSAGAGVGVGGVASVSLQPLEDVFTTLRLGGCAPVRAAAAAVVLPSSDNNTCGGGSRGLFEVLVAVGGDDKSPALASSPSQQHGALQLVRVNDDGTYRSFPITAASSQGAAWMSLPRVGAVSAVAAVGVVPDSNNNNKVAATVSVNYFVVAEITGRISLVASNNNSNSNNNTSSDVAVVAESAVASGTLSSDFSFPAAIAASSLAADGSVVHAAVLAADGDVTAVTFSTSSSGSSRSLSLSHRRSLPAPAEGAVPASLFVGSGGSAIIGWTDCELWGLPISAPAAAQAHALRCPPRLSIVSRFDFATMRPVESSAWLSKDDDYWGEDMDEYNFAAGDNSGVFWFEGAGGGGEKGRRAVFLSSADVNGDVSLYVAESGPSTTAVARLVCSAVLDTVAAEGGLIGLGASSEGGAPALPEAEGCDLFDVVVVPLDSGIGGTTARWGDGDGDGDEATDESGPAAFAKAVASLEKESALISSAAGIGLSIGNSVGGIVAQKVRSVFHRAIANPSRFANFPEFSELRADALLAQSHSLAYTMCGGDAEEEAEGREASLLTVADVRSAISYVSAAEEVATVPYATPAYVGSCVAHDLSCRLLFLIVVYMGWAGAAQRKRGGGGGGGGDEALVGTDPNTAAVVAEVGHHVEVLVAAIRAVTTLGPDVHSLAASTNNNNSNVVSSLVNTLGQLYCGDVVDILRVGQLLSAAVPTGSRAPRALAQWAAALRPRYPIVGHFSVAARAFASSTGGAANGTAGAALMAEVFSVSAHIAMLPTEAAKQALATMGLFVQQQQQQQQGGAVPASLVSGAAAAAASADRLVLSDVEGLLDAYPALAPRLYRVLLLRRLVGTHSSVLPAHCIAASFFPDVLILRRYAAEERGRFAGVEALLAVLVVDVNFILCRAAIDDKAYAEAARHIALASRELRAAASTDGIGVGVGIGGAIALRGDALGHYVATIVDRALAEDKAAELTDATISDTDIAEMIAQRLYSLSFAFASSAFVGPSSSTSLPPPPPSSSSSSPSPSPSSFYSRVTTPAHAEHNEAKRLAAATALNAYLCKRGGYGLSAHALFAIASAARTSGQSTVNTATVVVQLVSMAVAAARCIAHVPPPPLSSATPTPNPANNPLPHHRGRAEAPTLQRHASVLGSVGAGGGPSVGGALADLRPMSRLDVPVLEKRLFQARCEQKLQRIPRNVLKGPWREDAADRTRLERLVEELLTVRLWADARRLSRLCGLDPMRVFQCEAADLCATDYTRSASAEVAAQWAAFIRRVSAASTTENGHLPLRKALAAALLANHHNVHPRLKEELGERDLGALILVLMGSAKPTLTTAASGTTSISGAGGSTNNLSMSATTAVGGSFFGSKRLAGSLIVEILALATRYVLATDEALSGRGRGREDALRAHGLGPNAFISYPMLERVAAMAESIVSSPCPAPAGSRQAAIISAARQYLALLSKRSKGN